MARCPALACLFLSLLLPAPRLSADDAPAPVFTDEHLSFFESRVRPVLAEHCYGCHSHEAEKVRGGLYLDSRAGVIESAAAIPGDVPSSLLVDAVRWDDPHMRMPPAAKLPDQAIADLTRWVELGLPWPEEAPPGDGGAGFDLEQRKATHWAWRPPQRAALPQDASNPIDHFIAAKLAEHGLRAAPQADRATLIRRATLDLTGLPPTPEEVAAFVNDESPDAYEKLVDRLLASPRFGEQWGRHWLDLARYAESYGHEFDFNIYEPWRYRDYVIKALNDDVPYDQFVREQIAGDLIPDPRVDPETGENQSVLGTGFYWLGEQTHSPVDIKQHQADRIDNQIDVLTKTFQAVTVACARCHDHKFDAISTEDYYALYGVLQSTRSVAAELRGDRATHEQHAAIAEQAGRVERAMREHWDPAGERIADYLLAAAAVLDRTREIEDDKQRRQAVREQTAALAGERSLDAEKLSGWVDLTSDGSVRDGRHPLHSWHVMTTAKPEDAANWWRHYRPAAAHDAARRDDPRPGDRVLLDARDPSTWVTVGRGFEEGGISVGRLLPAAGRGDAPGQVVLATGLSSATRASGEQGALQTVTTRMDRRFIHVLAQGRGARVNIIVDGFELIRDPIYGRFHRVFDTAYPKWETFDLDKWSDGTHDVYVEVIESPAPDPSLGASPHDGHAEVYAILASDQGAPVSPGWAALSLYGDEQVPAREQLASEIARVFVESAARWQRGELDESVDSWGRVALLNLVFDSGLLELPTHSDTPPIVDAVRRYRGLDHAVNAPPMGLAAMEGTPRDCAVFNRGSHRSPSSPAPRSYLTAIVGDGPDSVITVGSGRRELADAITDPSNPLTARVMVNRLWHHLLGRGIVPTVDNFGYLGQPPSHPELLDHLAVVFVEDDAWSVKAMIKRIMVSDTYRQSSDHVNSEAELLDPDNLMLHRQNLRRLNAEAIRDTILAVSGSLNEQRFGPPVPPYLTEFMEGRGRPGQSGPLDGGGRRSIYLGVRRNFLSPMMLTFDTPIPFSTVGARNISNVPAQALTLMNDPFVHEQSGKWADRLVQDGAETIDQRLEALFITAIGRPPEPAERAAAAAFIAGRATHYGVNDGQALADARPWRELCHAVYNMKAFIYVR